MSRESEDADSKRRHSVPDESEHVVDPTERAKREAANGLRQFDVGFEFIEEGITRGKPFKLRPSAILTLHREALQGLDSYAGNWRPAGVSIGGSRHVPPGGHLVPGLIEEMCDYVNDNAGRSPIHLASYVMW